MTDHEKVPATRKRVGTTSGLLLIATAFTVGGVFRDPLLRVFRHMQAGDTGNDRPALEVSGQQLWTCSMHPQVIRDRPGICPICHMVLTPMTAGAHGSAHANVAMPGVVTIDPVVVQRMGVRTATVATGKLTHVVRAVGTLMELEPLQRDVNLRVSGWVDALHANFDGMPVEAGKPLFDLYSPELTLGVDELIAARKQRDASPADASATDMYDAAVVKLLRLGITDRQIENLAKGPTAPRAVPILSPMTGHVRDKSIYVGGAVKAGDLAMKIVDRSQMWADLQVYEPDLAYLRAGQEARIFTPSQLGKSLAGQVSFVHPHLDMTTRSALVRVVVNNKDHLLREGMYVSAELDWTLAEDTVVVPREAVIDTGTRQLAFLWNADGVFEPRTVKLGLSDGRGAVQVLDGLHAGDRVVTSGQFLIDSESRMQEAVQKLMRERLTPP
jgi:Cu(I)/Ag(I) efflux system membrane fusion protein